MASTQHVLLSPAELAYLHDSLSVTPPVRPDGRLPTQFRPLIAENGILPSTNGSARICFADGTEAIVGAKAEVEKTRAPPDTSDASPSGAEHPEGDNNEDGDGYDERGRNDDWLELMVEIPGYRDDDAGTAFLSAMISEALLADGEFTEKLKINSRFHWKLYLDILLISQPFSYPLPLLSLTTHLALLATRLPKLKSEGDEDPLFDDDWAASTFLYPRRDGKALSRPPITLLVMAVQNNVIFDPSKEELAVADAVLAVSVGEICDGGKGKSARQGGFLGTDSDEYGRSLRLLAVRTVDPPSRLTPSGVANAENAAYGAAGLTQNQPEARTTETEAVEGVWRPPRGGVKVFAMATLISKALEKGGVVDEVLDGLDGVDAHR